MGELCVQPRALVRRDHLERLIEGGRRERNGRLVTRACQQNTATSDITVKTGGKPRIVVLREQSQGVLITANGGIKESGSDGPASRRACPSSLVACCARAGYVAPTRSTTSSNKSVDSASQSERPVAAAARSTRASSHWSSRRYSSQTEPIEALCHPRMMSTACCRFASRSPADVQ